MASISKLTCLAQRSALGFLLLALILPLWSSAQEFKPPEEVFHYATRIDGERLIVTWRIEPKHYLYRHRLGFETTTPGVQLGPPAWPQGEPHEDEFFGTQEIYRGTVEFPIPISFQGARPEKVALALKWQGCADEGLCYPPTTWTTTVAVPRQASGGLKSLFGGGGSEEQDFLPPDQAFALKTTVERADQVILDWQIAPDYYLYKERLKVRSDTPGVQIGTLILPAGTPKEDEFLGRTEVYHDQLRAIVPVSRGAGAALPLTLKVTYQGCAEAGLCYNPITKTVQVQLPPTTAAASVAPDAGVFVAEQDRLAEIVRNGNVLAVLGTFFLIGLGLSLTPCVLPMIPILSGIIVGQGDGLKRSRSFALAFTYVQGMALTYAAAGAVFVLAFKQAPQAFFQQPWIIVTFALLFAVLACAMFGFYNLQLPSALQTRLNDMSNRQKSGTYVGTFIMGALSALVVTACVAPAVIAALSVISQTGQVARGAGALYATGLGMGVPLLAVGASAGTLLPKVGPWMDAVKQLFGVLFLFVAAYLLSSLLPGPVALLLYAVLAIPTGVWIFSLKRRDGSAAPTVVRGAGLIAIVYGVLLLVGAASGSHDALQPLDRLAARTSTPTADAPHSTAFRRIKTAGDLDRELAAARAAGRPTMLDFYAEWCVSCKEMEKYTFGAPAVRAALRNTVLLQADVTANDAEDQALMQRFNIFGPPTIAFFGADGTERGNFRVVGYMPAERFAAHVRNAVGPGT
ncbi:MAG TPA: protein-disulfide reductase DsbD [Steroidobacteraceae bacterium]|nr:protein-disulfide reductase DsbD [Steroidobacteraceae bacterium]